MGDRIVIRLTDGEKWSPDLYCHSLGLAALMAVIDAEPESKPDGDPQQMMCNVVLECMDRQPQEYGFYLENRGEVRHGDLDNGEWTYNTQTREWDHDYDDWHTYPPTRRSRHLTMAEVIAYLEGGDEE